MNKMIIILSLAALMALSFATHANDVRFGKWDKDSDGKVSVEEFTKKSKNKEKAVKKFNRFDTDGNGYLSPEEAALIPARKKKK